MAGSFFSPKHLLLATAFIFLLEIRSASAANNIIWKNHCIYDLYFWTVPTRTREEDSAYRIIPAGSQFTETMLPGSIVVKIRDVPHYTVQPAGILQLEYYMDHRGNKLWYDSSIINCDRHAGAESPSYCPFAHGGLRMSIPAKLPPLVACLDSSCNLDGFCDGWLMYLRTGGFKDEPSLNCGLGVDVVFETCTDRSPQRTWENGIPYVPPLPRAPEPREYAPPPVEPGVTTRSECSPHTEKPRTYPVPHPDMFPEEIVCFDPDCACYGSFGYGDQGPLGDCTCQEGALECHFHDDCDIWWNFAGKGEYWWSGGLEKR
ncbi:hypothetical protein BU23DRAFT_227889 [Bimuria novae-zelandiae CBS 107.79]|uniref:Chitin-binding type-4 domain-containing protein n=1 Tax=Bimuria novae-zelandiae CBS 107.79 TaxID=1447943 RepID=A0A6A5VS89_9PLEO|nr:hypothetical protein BU23DRAFT_227889 [Bimuria novae-zelandiae CBS 107.79]